MADAVQGELDEYKKSEGEVLRLKNAMGVSEEDDPDVVAGALTDNTAKLTSAIRCVCLCLSVCMRVCMEGVGGVGGCNYCDSPSCSL